MTVENALIQLCMEHLHEQWGKEEILRHICFQCNNNERRSVNPSNIRLDVYCYNRYYAFEHNPDHQKLLELIPGTNEYILRGSNYGYTGEIYYKDDVNRELHVVGYCENGVSIFDQEAMEYFDLN